MSFKEFKREDIDFIICKATQHDTPVLLYSEGSNHILYVDKYNLFSIKNQDIAFVKYNLNEKVNLKKYPFRYFKITYLLDKYSVGKTIAVHQFYAGYNRPCEALLYNYETKYWDDTFVPFEEVIKMAEVLKYNILINKH